MYLGGQEATSERDALLMLSVTHLLTAAKELRNHFPDVFTYCNIPISDSVEDDARPFFETTHAFIEGVRTAGTCLLV